MTYARTAAWGTWVPMSIACGARSSASRYSGKDSQSQRIPSARAVPGMSSTPSISSMSHSWSSQRAGANPMPQLPTTAVVTPCQHDGVRCGSQVAWPSKWVCTSTKPGVTNSPSASTTRRARSPTRPTSTMRPASTATSATDAGAPVPSTTVPPRINRSCTALLLDRDGALGAAQRAPAGLLPELGRNVVDLGSVVAELVEHEHVRTLTGAQGVPGAELGVDADTHVMPPFGGAMPV